MARAWLLAVLLTALAASGEPIAPHRAPAPSLAESPSEGVRERQNLLAELWQRRILPPEANQWSPSEMAVLLRIRNAEASGAVSYLRKKKELSQGFAVPYRFAANPQTGLRLTKEGFERYLLLKSQDALAYFDSKDVEAKWAFQQRTMQGKLLFDGRGLLTEAGEELYARVLAGKEAFWRTSSGEIRGNRRPPAQSAPSYRPPPPPLGLSTAEPDPGGAPPAAPPPPEDEEAAE
ncbi:MAG: hypothetical protein HY921_11230 [Elusimicrobia bacterium]|nr:hypothetical protein [Elusimicrobiota bacterium]